MSVIKYYYEVDGVFMPVLDGEYLALSQDPNIKIEALPECLHISTGQGHIARDNKIALLERSNLFAALKEMGKLPPYEPRLEEQYSDIMLYHRQKETLLS